MLRLNGAAMLTAVAALLSLARPAAAGPIEWAYTAHVRTAAGTGLLDLGTERLLYDPSGHGTVEPIPGDYTITAPVPEMNLSGTHLDATGSQNNELRLFSVGDGWQTHEAASAPASDPMFLLTFTLTDTASGESGTVEFTGSVAASTNGEYPPVVLFTGGMWPLGSPVLTLGGNRYTLTPIGGMPDELEEPALMGLRVEAAAETPEPGTAALAGVGLFSAVGLRRRLRRV